MDSLPDSSSVDLEPAKEPRGGPYGEPTGAVRGAYYLLPFCSHTTQKQDETGTRTAHQQKKWNHLRLNAFSARSEGYRSWPSRTHSAPWFNRPTPGGPATKAGVTAGDLITELDEAPLKGLSLADVLAKLRGPANTTIKMKIVHKGQDSASDLSVVRAARRVNAVQLQVRVEQGKLVAEATGAWPILEFEKGKATPLVATSSHEFTVDDEDHTRIAFVRDAAGKVSRLILNPGPWGQTAAMIAPGPK